MPTCLKFSLEIHHKRSELCSIQVLLTLGFLIKTLILVEQRSSHMMMLLHPPLRKPNRKLKSLLDLDHSLAISTLMMLELEHVMKNQMVKSTLKIKNSVMLNFKKQFSMERTSRQSLVWLTHNLLRKTLLQFSMK